ncbi:MAG: hypothetical protein KAS47_05855 [Candidatus Heimdallarchaeota archaeon]|nr:hypothetical protein [Candidatus Heimdallarchaeota archaeon]
MVDETERAIDSIPKIAPKQQKGIATLNIGDLMTEKPRASVKEINGTKRLIKMIESKKKYTYSSRKGSSK